MEENKVDVLLNKKIENYNFDTENFAVEKELLVTITLKEYRGLIQAVMKKEKDEEFDKRWKTERENEKLKEENKNLRQALEIVRNDNECDKCVKED